MAVVTEDDRVRLHSITVSRLLDSSVEVAEGISANDRIVNNPSAALLDNDKVRVVTPAAGYDLLSTDGPDSIATPEAQAPVVTEDLGSKEAPTPTAHSPQ